MVGQDDPLNQVHWRSHKKSETHLQKHKTEEQLFSAATMSQRADYSQFETECLNNETTLNDDTAVLKNSHLSKKFQTPEKEKKSD